MKRAVAAGALVALALAFYGHSGPSEGAPAPLPRATPGEWCYPIGEIGAWGDRAFVCQLDPSDPTLRWRPL